MGCLYGFEKPRGAREYLGLPCSGVPESASFTTAKFNEKKVTAKNFLIFQQITTQFCRSCRAVCMSCHWLMFRQTPFEPRFFLFEFYFILR